MSQQRYSLFNQWFTLTLTATATAKSLQSCPTMCDPKDGSSPGSPIPGILQARTLEWVASECLFILLTHTSLKIFSVKEAWFFRWHITLTLTSHAWCVTATLCSFSSWGLWDLNLKMCFFVGNIVTVTVNNSWLISHAR